MRWQRRTGGTDSDVLDSQTSAAAVAMAARVEDEIAESLLEVVIAHVGNDTSSRSVAARRKALYLALMLRRLLLVERGELQPDDADFFGNKRMELAGSLLALLFEDLLKRFNDELKRIAAKTIPKVKAEPFDVVRRMRPDLITNALAQSLSSGAILSCNASCTCSN